MKRFFILLFLFSSCSVATLFIGKADYFITKEITKHLDLYYRQDQRLEVEIEQWLNQIKPFAVKLVAKLDEYPNRIQNDEFDKKYIYTQTEELVELFYVLTDSFRPIIAKYLAVLNKPQQEHFFELWDKSTLENKERYDKKRIKHSYERYKNYFGKLNSKQKIVFDERREFFFERNQRKHDYRIVFKEELIQAFANKKSADHFSTLIKNYLDNSLQPEDMKIYSEVTYLFLQEISIEQKEKFAKKMGQFSTVIKAFISTTY